MTSVRSGWDSSWSSDLKSKEKLVHLPTPHAVSVSSGPLSIHWWNRDKITAIHTPVQKEEKEIQGLTYPWQFWSPSGQMLDEYSRIGNFSWLAQEKFTTWGWLNNPLFSKALGSALWKLFLFYLPFWPLLKRTLKNVPFGQLNNFLSLLSPWRELGNQMSFYILNGLSPFCLSWS